MPLAVIFLFWIGLEAWLLAWLTDHVGGPWVMLWLIAAVVAGVLLIRHQGMRTIREMQTSVARGELPTMIVIEGLLMLFAGLLLIVPGVLSDAVALSLVAFGLRKRLAMRLMAGLAKARPDLKQPVTLEGQFSRKG